MLTRFDGTTLRGIGMEINDALAPIAEKYGIAIHCGGGDYVDTNATISLKLAVRDATGSVITKERSDFDRYASVYGMTADDFGREFLFNGHRFTIAGLKPGRPKYPIIATKHCDGKLYKLSADVVKLALDREGARTGSGISEIGPNEGPPSLHLWEAQADEG